MRGVLTFVRYYLSIYIIFTPLQAAGGIFGLIFTVPDLIDNCEELIKNKHQTEASTFLKTKANEIRETVKKLEKPLNELQ